jgi:hypothetical protein
LDLGFIAPTLAVVIGCARAPEAPRLPGVGINVAALSLPGVDDVCYDLEVRGAGGVIWSKGAPSVGRGDSPADTDTVCARQYGNGAGGGVTFVGTCSAAPEDDVDPTTASTVENRVTLWVDGLYKVDGLGHDDVGGWENPCVDGCPLTVTCTENADSRVDFDLTIMRQAQQGFFDFSVNFEDIFCSAKVDCLEAPDGLLSHNGVRDDTVVIGRACTSGANTSTRLLLSRTDFACAGVPTIGLDAYSGGDDGHQGDPEPGSILFQNAIYSASETSGGPSSGPGVVFVNQAIGVDEPPNTDCFVRGYFSAYDAKEGLPEDPVGAGYGTYPAVYFDVKVVTNGAFGCDNQALDSSSVETVYVDLDALNDVDVTALPSGQFRHGSIEMSVADVAPAEPQCPNEGTSLVPRALWVWQTSTFTNAAEKADFFAFAATHAVNAVYLQVALADMPATGADLSPLGRFIAEAATRCIDVELLVGDSRWALDQYRPEVLDLAIAAKHFANALNGAKPTAFHVDIEPHGLDGVTSNGVLYDWDNDGTGGTTNQRPSMMNQFLDTLDAVRGALGGTLRLHADVVFWLDGAAGFNPLQRVIGGVATGAPRSAHELVIDAVDQVHLMAYRDLAFGAGCAEVSCSANGIFDLSEAEVNYARSVGKTAVVGVETGNYGDSISFFEEDVATMEAELAKVSGAYAGHAGFAGFAIHDLVGYRALQAKTP